MSNVSNSCIHEVRTSLKKFTVHFPCAVFTQEHVFNHILKAIDGFDFSDQQQFEKNEEALRESMKNLGLEKEPKKEDVYLYWLQEHLNHAACCGSSNAQALIKINLAAGEVYVM